MNREKSAIEKATEAVIVDMNYAITHEWRSHGVPMPERQFRAIVAGYFEQKQLKEWFADFGIAPPEGDREKIEEGHRR